jgi:RNA polymerase sigma factor (sigma-70 family)
MPEDTRSDEALIEAYRGGDESALNILFERWTRPLWFSLARRSSFGRDDAYLDDLAQDILLIIFEQIKSGKFISSGEGSFKRWLYTVAQLETLCQDRGRRRAARPVSQVYPEEPTGIPDDVLTKRPTETKDYDGIKQRLNDALSQLSLEEQKLMRLVSEGKSYKKIQKNPCFSKYSLDYLMRKVYNIRQKILKKEVKR